MHRSAKVQLDLPGGELGEDRPGVGQGAGQPVQPGHHEGVVFSASRHRLPQPRAVPVLVADSDAGYDVTDEIDLSTLEPLIARPTSPGNVGHSGRLRGPKSARS